MVARLARLALLLAAACTAVPARYIASGKHGNTCNDALLRLCGSVTLANACDICAGSRQRELKLVGCTDASIRTYCATLSPCDVYVNSINGSDTNTGTAPSAALATIAAALRVKNSIRQPQDASRLCRIYIAGTHYLNSTLQMWKIDGHTKLLAWSGAAPAPPTISGAGVVPATSWHQNFHGGWQADISPLLSSAGIDPSSNWQPASIFAGDQRVQRVRTPILHWDSALANDSTLAGKDACRWGFVYSSGDISDDWDLSPAALKLWRVVAFHQWSKSYHTVRAVFPANRTILFHQPAPFYYGQFVSNTASGKRYYIEGAQEIPLRKGSATFRLHPGGLLEYPDYGVSVDGSNDQPVLVAVPLLQRLLSINHAPGVEVNGLRMLHTTIQCPSTEAPDIGLLGAASRGSGTGGTGSYTTCDDEFTGPKPATAKAGELLLANNCSGLVLRNISAAHAGGTAISVWTSANARVERTLVTDAGGSGIEVAESMRGSIVNSRVIGAGYVIQNLPGITIHDCPYGLVTRCEVTNIVHTRGIRFDSSADSGRFTNVSWNHIHDCGCGSEDCLSDGGGLDGMNTDSKLPIYLENNWVHDIDAHHFGGAGIYADVSSNAMHIKSNVVHDVADQVLYWNVQPGGKVPLLRDAEPFVVTNNLLVKNKMNKGNDAPWQLHATPIVTWKGYTPATFERNILVVNLSRTPKSAYRGGPILATTACAQQFKVSPNATCGDSPLDNFKGGNWSSNVYFNFSDPEEMSLRNHGFCGFSFARWQQSQLGEGSVVADPSFVDGFRGDFRLREGGPAQTRGFEQWDYRSVGPDW